MVDTNPDEYKPIVIPERVKQGFDPDAPLPQSECLSIADRVPFKRDPEVSLVHLVEAFNELHPGEPDVKDYQFHPGKMKTPPFPGLGSGDIDYLRLTTLSYDCSCGKEECKNLSRDQVNLITINHPNPDGRQWPIRKNSKVCYRASMAAAETYYKGRN